jgi:hypothetical protein
MPKVIPINRTRKRSSVPRVIADIIMPGGLSHHMVQKVSTATFYECRMLDN